MSARSIPLVDAEGQVRTLAQIEAEAIRCALAIAQGSRSEAARLLGVGRSTLYRKLAEMGESVEAKS